MMRFWMVPCRLMHSLHVICCYLHPVLTLYFIRFFFFFFVQFLYGGPGPYVGTFAIVHCLSLLPCMPALTMCAFQTHFMPVRLSQLCSSFPFLHCSISGYLQDHLGSILLVQRAYKSCNYNYFQKLTVEKAVLGWAHVR